MNKIKRIVIFIFLVSFFLTAFFSVAFEIKKDFDIFQRFHGLKDEEKREILVGELYGLIKDCRMQIPEKSNVLLLTDNANEGLNMSYHLYPRKLFFNNVAPIRKLPGDFAGLDKDWLYRKKISWIILRFSNEIKLNKIVDMDNWLIRQFTE
jgi:hypothetical protein